MYINKRTEEEFQKFDRLPEEKLREIREKLDKKLYDNKFYVAGSDVPVPVHFNSIIFSAQENEKFVGEAKIVLGAIGKVAKEYYNSEELQRELKIDPFEKKLFLEIPCPKGFGVMRLDGFWDGENLRFVELNSDYPDGIALIQNAFDSYDEIMKDYEMLNNSEFAKFDNEKLFYDNMMILYQMNGGKETNPNIAVVAPKGRAGDNEYQVMVEFLKKKGHKAFHVEPKDITQDENGFLFFGKEKIDIVRRAAEIRYFKAQKEGEKIFDAYRRNKVIMINSFHDRLWGIKSIFSVLRNEKFDYLFTDQEREVIKKTIPMTYIISSDKEEVEKSYYWDNKDGFVIKPSDMSEAEDIFFGKNISLEEWQNLLLSERCNGWIVQELVDVKKRKVITLKDGKKTVEELYSDLTTHFFMGEDQSFQVGTTGNRTSSSAIVNVSKGGGINEVKIMKS